MLYFNTEFTRITYTMTVYEYVYTWSYVPCTINSFVGIDLQNKILDISFSANPSET